VDERELWWALCEEAWAEQDPVKLLNVTMRIDRFLARKQERLDAAYDQAQRQSFTQSSSHPTKQDLN
jgi:hypothetical protein